MADHEPAVAVEMASVTAPVAQLTTPSEDAAISDKEAPLSIVPPKDAAATPTGGEAMNTEYLEYLNVLNNAWSDCPSVELVFKDLAYSIRNDSTIADAQSLAARRVRAAAAAGGSSFASKSEENIPSFAKSTWSIVKSPVTLVTSIVTAASKVEVNPEEVLMALSPVSGVIKPGSMTLVLAPPGAGKSVFLRALTGRLNGDSGLTGDIFFNGLSLSECLEKGIHITRLCSYVGQSDVSFPVLTVQETLEFAKNNGVGDVNLLRKDGVPNVELEAMDAKRTQLLMELLGMMECKDTIIGSDMLRGISGGQKKRAAIGESLMSNARLYALDEVSNGLDSAVTLHIFDALKQACALNGSSVVTALQQVTPETYALFDSVILMREGHVLYHGPRTAIPAWLSEVMGVPFVPEGVEEAGFLIDLLSDPKQALEKAAVAHKVATARVQNSGVAASTQLAQPSPTVVEAEEREPSVSAVNAVVFHLGSDECGDSPVAPSPVATPAPDSPKLNKFDPNLPFARTAAQLEVLVHVDELEKAYHASSHGTRTKQLVSSFLADRHSTAERTMDTSKWSPYTLAQYGRQFPHSTAFHTALCCQREIKLMTRNLAMIVPRIFSAILMGFVYGTLFFQLATDDFSSKLGLVQNAIMFVAFANFQELPVASEGKQVVVRQIDAGFYPSISYTVAVNLLTAPLAILEVIVFGIMVYFIPGFVHEADRLFFWLFLLLSVSSAMSQMFRMICYLSSNADVAEQLNMPFVLLFVVFGGFLIPRTEVPNWLIWAYYISPFSWATDSLAINEFSAGIYGGLDPLNSSQTVGYSYLESFGLRPQKVWQWYAVLYLWGFYLTLTAVSTVLLAYTKPTPSMGAKRALVQKKKSPNDASAVLVDVDAPPQKRLGGARSSAKASFQLSALPFTPATLAWKDIKYTVFLGKEKTPRVLLNQISGFAEPGKLTALMGASGAGKTTLMDVIAGRKTTGLIEHDHNIFVNGRPKDDQFEHLTGYVEQTDIHVGTATVREALEFSAHLRLPKTVSETTRAAFINEVMDLVGLTSIQNRMIGDIAHPSLSTGQLKLLTIAVELVANPAIIFLDEPTSGLDSKSAYRVMRAIKRIAATNRTIVCTIHQPSQEVFFMFDKLLLLRRGGETVYFDDIGAQGDKLINYMTAASQNMLPYSPLISPANWMLDVISLDATSLVEEQKAAEAEAAAEAVAHGAAEVQPLPAGSPKIGEEVVQQAFKAKLLKAAKSSATGARNSLTDAELEAKADACKPIQFSEEWRNSAAALEVQKNIDFYSVPQGQAASSGKFEYVGDLVRLGAVVKRGYLSHWRSPAINVTRCLLMFIIGLYLGLVYQGTSVRDYAGLNSLMAAVFLGVSIPSSICSTASLSTFFRQRAVFYRESSVKMYGYKIYTATMSLQEIPYLVLGNFCFLIPFYFITGLSTNGAHFFEFFLAGLLMILFFNFLDQVFVASLPNLIAAQALNGLAMSMFFAFGGLFIKASSIPIGWKWFYYIDPIPKAFIATMMRQVHCEDRTIISLGDASIDGCRQITIPGETAPVQVYAYVSNLLGGNTDQYGYYIGWLILSLVVLRSFSIYLFKKVSHLER